MEYNTSDYLEQLQQDKQDLVDNLTTQGITGLTGDETFTELVPEVLNISGGESKTSVNGKDVNFYDYDGTRLYSYSKIEFLELEELPANPTHQGLTSQGWNWSYQDAINYVINNGKLDIGQTYITNDGATRIYIELNDGKLSPTCSFGINGTVIIDWGDGHTDTVTGTNISTRQNTQHIYENEGFYIIRLIPNDNTDLSIKGISFCSTLLWNNMSANADNKYNAPYLTAIKKIEIVRNITISEYAFQNCYSLSNITIPNNLVIGSNAFQNCYSLSSIIIPTIMTYISPIMFNNCYSLSNAILNNNIIHIYSGAFQNCYSLPNIKTYNNITEVRTYAFQNCYSLVYLDFTNNTTVPTLQGTNAFQNIPTDCKIIVPDNLYDSWKTATNWSTYASYIISKSDWEAL